MLIDSRRELLLLRRHQNKMSLLFDVHVTVSLLRVLPSIGPRHLIPLAQL